jgi:hypothetical protein
MKKSIIYFAILLIINLLSSCKSSQTGGNTSGNPQEIEGYWQEIWDVGNSTDVSYSDKYRLKMVDNKLVISCATRKYQFENLSYQNKVLRFKLINTDKYVGETYVVEYELTFQEAKKVFEGKAKTNKGAVAKILWEKM